MDVFELARRYHDELGIKEASVAALAAELFGEMGLSIHSHLTEEGYALKGTRFMDYDKSLVLEFIKGDRTFEVILRTL
ncbi:hypothetical protein [Palaeococcus ferrophilus]|uniref:hypothetical protein n=1 Tax=Palaeococcus ferrophilus TaxID=83868 RepID=UPI00064E4226|nr:hypothetical protein [Palaeococcus ferrophilus]